MFAALLLLLAFAIPARAFSPGCEDECSPFSALSCPSNDPTCLPTYCSSNSYDLYETCLACWQANPDPNVVTTQTSDIYQSICNLVYQCSLRKVTIAGPAPSNIACAAPGWNGAASHGITPWTGSGAVIASTTAGMHSVVAAVSSTTDAGSGAATPSSTAGTGTAAGSVGSTSATGTGVAPASPTGSGAAVVSSSSAARTSATPSASVSKNSKSGRTASVERVLLVVAIARAALYV